MRNLNNYLIIYDESVKTCKVYSMKSKRAIMRAILESAFQEHDLRITSAYLDNNKDDL